MRWVGQTPPDFVSRPFLLVLERAIEHGAFEPGGLAFLDSNGAWQEAMSRLSLADRRRCIAIALDAIDLAGAIGWSIGGGVLLPPSMTRVAAACEAVRQASALPGWSGDPEVVEAIGRKKDAVRVGLLPSDLWAAMVGLRGSLETLTALASGLERPAVIAQGPSLILRDVARADIESAWKCLEGRPLWAGESGSLSIEGDTEVGDSDSGPSGSGPPWPVAQWPSGRTVARWRVEPNDSERPWRLETVDGTPIDHEIVSSRRDSAQGASEILRVDGVFSSDLERAGSPGSVVVEAFAREAERLAQTLWIPGLSRRASTLIRRWGLGVWVDGRVLIHDS